MNIRMSDYECLWVCGLDNECVHTHILMKVKFHLSEFLSTSVCLCLRVCVSIAASLHCGCVCKLVCVYSHECVCMCVYCVCLYPLLYIHISYSTKQHEDKCIHHPVSMARRATVTSSVGLPPSIARTPAGVWDTDYVVGICVNTVPLSSHQRLLERNLISEPSWEDCFFLSFSTWSYVMLGDCSAVFITGHYDDLPNEPLQLRFILVLNAGTF